MKTDTLTAIAIWQVDIAKLLFDKKIAVQPKSLLDK
jgi:hypothetical protein